MTMDAKNFVKL